MDRKHVSPFIEPGIYNQSMELHKAVIEHDVRGVNSAISSPFVNQSIIKTAIVLASYVDAAEIVKTLLEASVPPNCWDIPLSCQRKWETEDTKLHHAKIDSDMSPFSGGWTPRVNAACLAAFYGHTEVLDVLIKASVDLNYDPYLYTFLGIREVDLPSNTSKPSWNALTCALFGKQWKIANMLVDEGWKPTSMKGQEKAWQFVLRNRAMDMARVLLCQNHRHLPPEMIREISSFV